MVASIGLVLQSSFVEMEFMEPLDPNLNETC
jgi:hypothetical protein